MKMTHNENGGVKEILERREAELALVLRKRDGIAIEKSADQMDEIQYASERDLAIRNVDRETVLLREVRAALRRIQRGQLWDLFGVRNGNQLQTSRGCPMGAALHQVPGGGGSGSARGIGPLER